MDIHCLNERFTNKHLRVRILRCNLSDWKWSMLKLDKIYCNCSSGFMNSFKFNTKTWPLYYAMHSLPFPNGDEMFLNETIIWSTTLTRLQSSKRFTRETVTSYLSVKGFSGEKVWVCAIERWHILKSKNRASIQKRNKTFSLPFFWGRPTSLIWSVTVFKLERK